MLNHRSGRVAHEQLQCLFWSLLLRAWICLGFSSSTSVFSVLMSLAATNKSRPQTRRSALVSQRGVRGQTPIKCPPEKQGLPGRASRTK